MAIKTLICGLSGTGKSTSARNLKEVAVVNPVNKPLPFKNHFEMLNGVTDSAEIIRFMKSTDKKIIIVDDFQYLLSIPYMRRIKESGWDKYNDFASNYFEIISVCDELPEDTTVYFMTHTETLEDGTETVKLIGKLLREKICIEGLFTTVLKTMVNDGKYYFITQNNGHDNVKSPLGMFDSYAIDNDLAYVDAKIRSYYEVGSDYKTDEEMLEADKEAKREEIAKPEPKATRRQRKTRPAEPVVNEAGVRAIAGEPNDEEDVAVLMGGDTPAPTVEPNTGEAEPPVRRRRRRTE